jgi:opacity protein-like surface antigen
MRTTGLGIAVILALACFARAQDEGHFDVSIGYGGVFSRTSTSSTGDKTLKPTTSGAGLATFRYRFSRMHGIEFNFAHTANSQFFSVPPDTYRVPAAITEYSGAYVLSPFHTNKVEPFLFGGAGALRFKPGTTFIDGFQSDFGATRQTSLAFLYGGGMDYRVWRAFALRFAYRGLIYKVPDFRTERLFLGIHGHMAEPCAGIVVKF